MSKHSATFAGTLRAVSNEKHPLQTIVEFVLTDFKPNKNNQAIPVSEADSLIRSAFHMPLKIRLDKTGPGGHKDAYPIGPITNVELIDQETDPKLIASAIVWRDEFPDVDQFLKTATDPIGTSWELYYQSATAENGIDWLNGVVFAGTAIVKDPAYGNRTRIYGIAENMEELQTQFESLQTDLANMLMLMSDLYWEAVEAEKTNEVLFTAETIGDRFNELFAAVRDRVNRARGLAEELETAKAELTTLQTAKSELETTLESAKAELDQYRAEKAEAEKAAKELERKTKLIECGIAETDIDTEFVMSLGDTAFSSFVAQVSKLPRASASTQGRAPDFMGGKTELTIEELALALTSAK